MSRIGAGLLLHGEVLSVDDVLSRIDAVTREEAHEAARDRPRRHGRSPRWVRSTGRNSTPGSSTRAEGSPGSGNRDAIQHAAGHSRVPLCGSGCSAREAGWAVRSAAAVLARPGLELAAAVDPGCRRSRVVTAARRRRGRSRSGGCSDTWPRRASRSWWTSPDRGRPGEPSVLCGGRYPRGGRHNRADHRGPRRAASTASPGPAGHPTASSRPTSRWSARC